MALIRPSKQRGPSRWHSERVPFPTNVNRINMATAIVVIHSDATIRLVIVPVALANVQEAVLVCHNTCVTANHKSVLGCAFFFRFRLMISQTISAIGATMTQMAVVAAVLTSPARSRTSPITGKLRS